jgi:hypothetical protein
MALETLNGVEKIGGFDVGHVYGLQDYKKFRMSETHILVDHEFNTINLKLQKGPIKEVGVNGCQVDTLIETAKIIIEKFQEKHYCVENLAAIMGLSQAIYWLNRRREDREKRGVEGTSKT